MNSHRFNILKVLVLSTSFWLALGCHQVGSSLPSDVVATVGETVIRSGDLQAELDRRSIRGQRPEPAKVLDEMILREALVVRARQLDLHKDPDLIRGWKNLLIAKLKERELEPRLNNLDATAEERKGQIVANPQPQVRLAILRQTIHPRMAQPKIDRLQADMEEARLRAEKLPANEQGFGSLAIDYSDDQVTRYRGGDFGWIDKVPDNPAFERVVLDAILELKQPGEISRVIRGTKALYLVRLVERRNLELPSKAGELTQYRARLDHQKQAERSLEEKARASARIRVFQENIVRAQTVVSDETAHLPHAL